MLSMDLTFILKIGPNLENWFLNLGGVFSRVGINDIGQVSDATSVPLHFFHTLDLDQV